MKLQGTQSSQNNPHKRTNRRFHTSQFQNLLQSNLVQILLQNVLQIIIALSEE